MIDFDALFEKYLKEWIEEHSGEYKNADELEEKVATLYEEYVTTPCAEAGGLTPEQYYAQYTNPEELVNAFVVASDGEGNACSLLLDRIIEIDECAEQLVKIIERGASDKVLIAAVNLLEDMGAKQPIDTLCTWLIDENRDEGVVEKAVEILKENADTVKDRLLSALSAMSNERKLIVAEVLAECKHDDKIYALLKELFELGNNVPFVAAIIARYGDERAAEFLYPALDKCNYIEFIEIRNAIEQMGGSVDEEYRDFSDDPYYKLIKNSVRNVR